MVDLSLDVNILPSKSCEVMGSYDWDTYPFSGICITRIYSLLRLKNVEVELTKVKAIAKFEVVKIMDDNDLYATLRIELGFDYDIIIDLNQWKMNFEYEANRVVQPLVPYHELRYFKYVEDVSEGCMID